ncbi:MAG TPA: ChaN family lipoprotein [Salinivirgaceae bacterium]|nr:ChaN family lipoprotein [Salinivirgaceae bacterium]
MLRTKLLLFGFIIISGYAVSQKPVKAYDFYNSKGEAVSFDQVLTTSLQSDVVFIGEYHNCPIMHWFEIKLLKHIHQSTKKKVILGMEMFESDNQLLLDEYLTNTINQKNFEDEVKLWPNYKTDYKPMVEYCKQNEIRIVATNIPRRYAAKVNRSGFEVLDSLSSEAKQYIAPMPIDFDPELPSYKAMTFMGMGENKHLTHIVKAQAIKDATMAYFIHKHWQPNSIFVHINGSFHSDNREGIAWYLMKYNNKLKLTVISIQNISDWNKINEIDFSKADFTLVVDEDMTKTY